MKCDISLPNPDSWSYSEYDQEYGILDCILLGCVAFSREVTSIIGVVFSEITERDVVTSIIGVVFCCIVTYVGPRSEYGASAVSNARIFVYYCAI